VKILENARQILFFNALQYQYNLIFSGVYKKAEFLYVISSNT
jgi:hypothetical protein